MALILGRIKCYFCEEKEGFMQSVHAFGIYGEMGKRLFYHLECLEIIEIEPEKFNHIMVDKAIHITNLKKRCMENHNDYIIKKHRNKVETLHKNNFERMMPRK